MKKYKLLNPLQISGGVLGLTDEQAGLRMEYLKAQKKGEYLVVGKVKFKAGEIIGMDNPLKVYLRDLEEIKAKK